jgi:(p)ppGpp synthase/HD superfamily hydrolase
MTYSSRFETALAFAARLHGNQMRKVSNVPYVSHLLAVAAIAIEYGATEDQAIAALLHDAIEDQGGEPTEQVIRRMFGNAVAEIVRGCSERHDPQATMAAAQRAVHRPPASGHRGGPPGVRGRQAAQRPQRAGRLPEARRWAVGELQG